MIALANQKGGVGKTTTAVNLSACLGAFGQKVLLFDADPQGNATGGFGISKRTSLSVYDAIVLDVPLDKIIIKSSQKNVDIVPSHMSLAGAEVELVPMREREYRIRKAIEPIKSRYDYILCDCPPSLGLLTINALTASDSVLLPIQCEYYALEGMSQLINTMKQVKKVLNPRLELEGVLLTMFDARTNLSIMVVDEVKKHFPNKVYKTIIPRNVRLSEAPSYGMSIIAYDKTSRGAECYMDLATELLKNNGKKAAV